MQGLSEEGWIDLAARQSFGFGNANYAGAFFALLALALWGFVFISKKAFWPCLVLSLGLAFLLLLTQSRGAMVGLALGMAVILPWLPFWKWRTWIAGSHLLLMVVGAFGMTSTGVRIEKALRERTVPSTTAWLYGGPPRS